MKRIFALLLSLLMVLSFAACGEEKRTTKRDKKNKETTNVVTATAPVATEPIDVPVTTPQGQVTTGDSIFKTADYALTVTSVDLDDSYYGIVINTKAENFTADKEYTIMLESITVNGLDTSGVCYIDVEGGEVKNDDATVSREFLEMAGIDTVKGFKATFYIIDEDYNTLETKTYSYGEDVTYTRTPQSTDKVLFDKDGVVVTLTSKGFEDDLDYKMVFYIENNTQNEVYVSTDNAKVNDKEESLYLGAFVQPGGRTFEAINIYDFEFEELGIKSEADVKDFKFDLDIQDWDNYEDIGNVAVTVTP